MAQTIAEENFTQSALKQLSFKMLPADEAAFECRDEKGQHYMVTVQGWYDRGLPLGLNLKRFSTASFNRSYLLSENLQEEELERGAALLAQQLEQLKSPESFRDALRALNRMSRSGICEAIFSEGGVQDVREDWGMHKWNGGNGLYGRAGQERDWARQLALVRAQEVSIDDVQLHGGQALLLLSAEFDLRSVSLTRQTLSELQAQSSLRCVLINPCGLCSASLANLLYGQFVCLMHRQPFSLIVVSDAQIRGLLAA